MCPPVLFLIFNRPQNTLEVFEQIRAAKPSQLFVAADGPREGNSTDVENCKLSRQVVELIDWNCEVKTLLRDTNLGCKHAVSTAIDWFFTQVDEGIILEDDCVPDATFFEYCSSMLASYRDDSRVMMIAGTNYIHQELMHSYPFDYFFANYYPIWGWATWRRAWRLYDVDIESWREPGSSDELRWLFPHEQLSDYYSSMFNLLDGGFDTWDIQWWFACIFSNGLCVVPSRNLISNIGVEGTHTSTQGEFAIRMATASFEFSRVRHPKYVHANGKLSKLLFKYSHAKIDIDTLLQMPVKKNFVPRPYFITRLIRLLKRCIRKLVQNAV